MNAAHITVSLGDYEPKNGVDTFTARQVGQSGLVIGSLINEQSCMEMAAQLYLKAKDYQERFDQITTEYDRAAAARINAEVAGFSTAIHYAFFRELLSDLLAEHESPFLVMLGVYRGRDMSFVLDIMEHFHPDRHLNLIGVDRFQDVPSEDWPEHKRGLSWKDAGYSFPPSLASARDQISKRQRHNAVVLVQQDDADFLRECIIKPHAFYLDTSHDKATVVRQIDACGRLLVDRGIICGDDLYDSGTWGVESAVKERLSRYTVFGDWIWRARKEDIKA